MRKRESVIERSGDGGGNHYRMDMNVKSEKSLLLTTNSYSIWPQILEVLLHNIYYMSFSDFFSKHLNSLAFSNLPSL